MQGLEISTEAASSGLRRKKTVSWHFTLSLVFTCLPSPFPSKDNRLLKSRLLSYFIFIFATKVNYFVKLFRI